jgi:hypothetical protein
LEQALAPGVIGVEHQGQMWEVSSISRTVVHRDLRRLSDLRAIEGP